MKDPAAVSAIIEELKRLYPEAACSLPFDPDKAYELLFSVRLAAQCTDARVNMVTPVLYARFPTLESLAAASEEEVGEIIHSTGFWRAKARDIVAASRMLVEEYGGRVPDSMEDLLRLPGVGRKTANLILGDVYGREGYVCDTHCIRITGLLGLTDGSKDPLKVEVQLRRCIPPEESTTSATGWSSTAGRCAWPGGRTAPPAPCGPGAPTGRAPRLRRRGRDPFSKFRPPSGRGRGHISALPVIYWRDNNAGGYAMKQNKPSNLQQLLSDKAVLAQVASSPDAKALAAMLSQGQSQASLKQIAESAAKGDTAQLGQLIQSVAGSPGGAELLRRLNESFGQKK